MQISAAETLVKKYFYTKRQLSWKKKNNNKYNGCCVHYAIYQQQFLNIRASYFKLKYFAREKKKWNKHTFIETNIFLFTVQRYCSEM